MNDLTWLFIAMGLREAQGHIRDLRKDLNQHTIDATKESLSDLGAALSSMEVQIFSLVDTDALVDDDEILEQLQAAAPRGQELNTQEQAEVLGSIREYLALMDN
jgi:hypothetical protein